MFLEAQFGPNVTPIKHPKLRQTVSSEEVENTNGSVSTNGKSDSFSKEELIELHRLNTLGIPVPGIEVKVDACIAKIWLEDLEVEVEAPRNMTKSLHDRVKAVVERAIECVSGIAG